MLILGIIFAGISLLASRLLAPRNPTAAKQDPYECGITSSQEPPERFPVRFFLVGMIFIVFDVEIIFMYPWALTFREIGLFGLVAMLIFSFAVFESFLYIIGNGALEWGPVKQIMRNSVVDPNRTTNTTIRRVGLEGRIEAEEEAAYWPKYHYSATQKISAKKD